MSSDLTPLLTPDDVRRIAAERQEAIERVAELDKKLEAIRLLLGEERMTSLLGQLAPTKSGGAKPKGRPGPSIRSIIEDALAEAPKGMTYDELREAILKTELADQLKSNPNGFYNAIARLKHGDAAVMLGNRLIMPEALERLSSEERAELEEEEGGSTAMALILNTVKSFGRPMQPATCIEMVNDVQPDIRAGRIYAGLSRFVQRGQLARTSDGRYYVPGETDEKSLL